MHALIDLEAAPKTGRHMNGEKMAHKQRVNLRYPDPVACGSEETRERIREQYEDARAAMKVPYQVAPGRVLRLADGREIKEGCEVKESDLGGSADARPAWQRLAELVWKGTVLARD